VRRLSTAAAQTATSTLNMMKESTLEVAGDFADDVLNTGDDSVAWGESKVKRLGVPGGRQINTNRATRFIFQWRGSSFKSACTSPAALLHVGLFAGFWYLFNLLDDQGIQVRRFTVDTQIIDSIALLFAFVIATYIAFVMDRYTQRVDACTSCMESAKALCLEASVMLVAHKEDCTHLLRYMTLLLHTYYFTIDSPLTDDKWELCLKRGLCTRREVADLRGLRDIPAAIHIWCLRIIHKLNASDVLSDNHSERLEEDLCDARRLAACQRAYHESPIPMPFFHLTAVLSHTFLVLIEWNAAVRQRVNSDTLVDNNPLDDADQSTLPLPIGEITSVVVMVICVNTLRRIAFAMTNPFGHDETDYELDHDLRNLWLNVKETLARMPACEAADVHCTTPTASARAAPAGKSSFLTAVLNLEQQRARDSDQEVERSTGAKQRRRAKARRLGGSVGSTMHRF